VIHIHCPGLAPSEFVESFLLIQVNELPFWILLPGHDGSRSGHSHAQVAEFDAVADGQQEQAEGGFHSQSRELSPQALTKLRLKAVPTELVDDGNVWMV